MPKGGSGFRSSASEVAIGLTKGRGGSYFANAEDIRDRITNLYRSIYRRESIAIERDDGGKITNVKMDRKTMAQIEEIANTMSQNYVEFDRQANATYKDLVKQFQLSKPVFIRIENSAQSAKEQLNAGHFKIRTTEKDVYQIGGRKISGAQFRRNTMRERYIDVMGEAAARNIESQREKGGTTDATWLNAANEAIDNAKSAIYKRRGNNDYASSIFEELFGGYSRVTREAQAKRRK